MVKILIADLSGDSGCQVAALGQHETVLDILAENELVDTPPLIDFKVIPEGVNVAIIEGGVRTEYEEELAKEMRDRCARATSDVGCHWRWGCRKWS